MIPSTPPHRFVWIGFAHPPTKGHKLLEFPTRDSPSNLLLVLVVSWKFSSGPWRGCSGKRRTDSSLHRITARDVLLCCAVYGSNDNFKKRLLPLEGHRAMMEAVGFKAKGSLWEWTWHEDRQVEHAAVRTNCVGLVVYL